ncbi:hypothetical protein HK096_006066 [Nowakowskiella sp. JEL0078]|nr:hypothetical protein HK096_006066 [Nowakowskiella sp. JEL0078]
MSSVTPDVYKPLVSNNWLADNLNRADVTVLDGSWHLPILNRSALKEFIHERIPGAQYFDIDEISDKFNPLPHMLPTPEDFAVEVGKLGVSDTDHVVVYDTAGIGPAARVYWIFKVFGHENISILNGGLFKWKQDGFKTVSGDTKAKAMSDYSDILRSIKEQKQIVDARPSGRFFGLDPEPRVGIASGHIPGSFNTPFTEILDPDTKCLLDPKILREYFENKGVNLDEEITNTCGSGVTASVIYFSLEQAGAKKQSVYDGSWSEYASIPTSEIANRGPIKQ